MSSYSKEQERQRAGIPLFKDKKTKNGWVLNLVKQNDELLSTSLYNSEGVCLENKVFLTQQAKHVSMLKEYIAFFEEDPQKNYKKMSKINIK